jgi:plasmid stabilization system protein ParE
MTVRWLRRALYDMAAISDHIAADDPVAATQVVDHISHAVNGLSNPQLHHIGRPGRWPGTRELVLTLPYIVPYRVTEDAIEVLAVMHMAREWPDEPYDD